MDSPWLTFSSSKISISITNSRPSNQFRILGLQGDFRLICMSYIKPFFPPAWDGFSYVLCTVQDLAGSVLCCNCLIYCETSELLVQNLLAEQTNQQRHHRLRKYQCLSGLKHWQPEVLQGDRRDGNSVILTLTDRTEGAALKQSRSWLRLDFREVERGETSRRPITPLMIISFKYRLKSPRCTAEITGRALGRMGLKKSSGNL